MSGPDAPEYAESAFLAALLWSAPADPTIAATIALVHVDDFYRPVHAELYATITALIAAGPERGHDPASVLAELRRHGRLDSAHAQQLATALHTATTTEASGLQAPHYGSIVVADAYRRAYRAAADGVRHAAETLPEDDLWDYLCRHGRSIRAVRERLAHLRDGLTDDERTPR